MDYAPPYIGKMEESLQKEVLRYQKKAIKAQKKVELYNEYVKLCQSKLAESKKDEK